MKNDPQESPGKSKDHSEQVRGVPSSELLSHMIGNLGNLSSINILPITHSGMDNRVYVVETKQERFILRTSDTTIAYNQYLKEQWCTERSRKCGIPGPIVIEIAQVEQWTYSIHSYIEGVPGNRSIDSESPIWRSLGEYAHRIHGISSNGIGAQFTLDTQSFNQSWQQWVKDELRKIENDNSLVCQKILSAKQKSLALKLLFELTTWDITPMLCHGNLSLSNVIIDSSGVVHLIDWGNAVSHRTPHFDLAEIRIWNPHNRSLEWFLEGYGLSSHEYQALNYDIELLELWRALWCARRDVHRPKTGRQEQFMVLSVKRANEILSSARH